MSEETRSSTELTRGEVAELVSAGDGELIDVRRAVRVGRAATSPARATIEMNELTAAADSIPRDRPVLFYCRIGDRSDMAAAGISRGGV